MTRLSNFKKLLGIVLCLIMLIGSIYVPVSFSASAAGETTTFTFDTWVSSSDNTTAANNNTLGYYGVGWEHKGTDNKYVQMLGIGTGNNYNRKSGYRIEKNGEAYTLEPSTTYFVTMKVQATQKPEVSAQNPAGLNCYIKLGYDAYYDRNLSKNASNYLNTMNNVITTIASGKTGSDKCTFTNLAGNLEVDYSNTVWHEIQFVFTTPADLGTGDKTLALWGDSRSNFQIAFDDISITKYPEGTGIVILNDEYSGTAEVLTGAIDSAVTLHDVSDRAKDPSHEFIGWFLDADRTEAAENLVFTTDAKVLYTKWKSPITYTFYDSFNDNPITVSGHTGETFTIPADPVDPNGEQWFMGWFTTEEYTEEVTETTFGHGDKTFYSLWRSETAPINTSFEDYPYDTRIEIFGRFMRLENTAGIGFDDDYVLHLDYAGTYVYKYVCSKCNNKQNTEAAIDKHIADTHPGETVAISYLYLNSRAGSKDQSFTVAQNVENNKAYKVTLKFKALDCNSDVTFNVATSHPSNSWDAPNFRNYPNSAKTVAKSDMTGEWQEVTLEFTTNINGNGNAIIIYCTFANTAAEGKVDMLIDNAVVEDAVKPSEALITLVKNNGDADELVVSTRGETYTLPAITNPNGAEFLGWYMDEQFTVRAESTLTFTRKPQTVYAKWGAAPITFKDYPYSTTDINIFGRLMKIVNETGIGYNDDYAIRLDYQGDYVYKYVCAKCSTKKNSEAEIDAHIADTHPGEMVAVNKEYFNTRSSASNKDHNFTIGQNIIDNTLYRVSFKYKVNSANMPVSVTPITRAPSNIYYNPDVTDYTSSRTALNVESNEWQTADLFFTSDLASNVGNALSLYINLDNKKMDGKVDILFDDVLVEALDGDVIVLDSMGYGIEIKKGTKGDPLTLDKLDGKTEFLGWYLDKEFTTPFTATTFPEGLTTVYAKWAPGPLSFDNYTFSKAPEAFGRLIYIDNTAGIGMKDNYALHFDYEGSFVYKYVCGICSKAQKDFKKNTKSEVEAHIAANHPGETAVINQVLFNTRATSRDHSFTIANNIVDKMVYKVVFNYKITNANSDITVTPLTCVTGSVWDTPRLTQYTNSCVEISKDDADGEWHSKTIYLTAEIKTKDQLVGDNLFLSLTMANTGIDCKVDMLIDDIYVSTIPGDVVMFNTMGYGIEVKNGKAGEALTLPVPTGKTEFLGWYLDKEFTTPFTATTFPEGITTVYAKWAPGPLSFDNYTFSKAPEAFGRLIYIDNTAGIGMKDNYALHFDYEGSFVYKYVCGICSKAQKDFKKNTKSEVEAHIAANHPGETAVINQVLFNTRATGRDHSFTIAQNMRNKTIYKITYNYKVLSTNSAININFATANPSNIWDGPNLTTYSAATKTIKANATVGQWITETAYITTDLKKDGTALFMYLTMSNTAVDGKVDMLFDDISVTPIEGDAVMFNSQGYGVEIVTGKEGDKLNIPSFKGKSEFLGWFYDLEFTKPFSATTIPAGHTTVYAKWAPAPMDFSNYPFSTTDTNIFGRLMKLVNEKGIGYDDDYAMRLDFAGTYVYKYVCGECSKKLNTQADIDSHIATEHAGKKVAVVKEYFNTRTGAVRDHNFAIARNVKDKTLYKVTFKYKVVSSNVALTVTPITCNPGNIYYSSDAREYASSAVALNVNSKEWQTASFYMATDLKSAKGNGLSLIVNIGGSDSATRVDLLFDDVMVEAFVGDVVMFDSVEYGIKVVNGKKGEPLTYPTFKGETEFLGWYLDAEYTKPFTATTFPEGLTVVYGKWVPGPIKFNKYRFPTNNINIFGRLMRIENAPGIGVGDDYALRFDFQGDYIYKYVCSVCQSAKRTNDKESMEAHIAAEHGGAAQIELLYYNTRATNAKDHCFTAAQNVSDKSLYKVTFKYKMLSATCDAKVTAATSNPTSVWINTDYKSYPDTTTTLSKNATDWATASFFVNTDFKSKAGNALVLYLTTAAASLETKVDLLIDNLLVEKVDPPYVFFDYQNGEDVVLVNGKAGDKINVPTGKKFGHTFLGWYMDKECTIPFTLTHLAKDTALTAYAKYKKNASVTYDFEKYDIPYYLDVGKAQLNLVLFRNVKSSTAHSGQYVMEYDGTTELTHAANMVLAYGKEIYHVEKDKQYIVELYYRISQESTLATSIWFATSHEDNYYVNKANVSGNFVIHKGKATSKWAKATILVDTSATIEGNTALMLCAQNGDGKVQIDDVKITEVPEGQTGAVITTSGCNEIPGVIYGKKGESFVGVLPLNPKLEGKIFGGYFLEDANGGLTKLTEEAMIFGDKFMRIYAMFLDSTVTQDFEGDFVNMAARYEGYTIYDFDYEIYDSLKEGNSKDNVTSGRYSLHRKGESRYFENSVIFTPGETISSYHKYKVTMKVKLGKHFHTDGAIKVISNRSATYGWSKTGDAYAIGAIKDLKEGEWVEISHVFSSSEPYVSIQTPGYVELWIDDITFELITDEFYVGPEPLQYVEYVPNKRDAAGNVIDAVKEADIDSIIDPRLKLRTSFNYVPVIIGAAAALVIAAAVVLIILLSKKKKKKATPKV